MPTITATGAYREHGLIVVTFASVASATATGLPAGATTRDAHLAAAGGRAADLAVCESRRAAVDDLQPSYHQSKSLEALLHA